jgi:hypothetical protein
VIRAPRSRQFAPPQPAHLLIASGRPYTLCHLTYLASSEYTVVIRYNHVHTPNRTAGTARAFHCPAALEVSWASLPSVTR